MLRRKKRKTVKGSFTVESAFLYPIIVILIAFILYLSMSWYVAVRTTAEDTEELRELDTRSYFLDNVAQVAGREVEQVIEQATDSGG